MKKLDFIIAGVGKSGTTSLASMLEQSKDIAMSAPKEPWFFDSDKYALGMDYYFDNYFECYNNIKSVLLGEASSQTFFIDYALQRVLEHNPAIKIILILRNPVDRFISDWWMKYSWGLETLSLDRALEANLHSFSLVAPTQDQWQKYLDSHATTLTNRFYLEYGYYSHHIKKIKNLVGADQLHILLTDDLSEDVMASMKKVTNFLQIDKFDINPNKKKVGQKRSSVNIRIRKNFGKFMPKKIKNLLAPTRLYKNMGGVLDVLDRLLITNDPHEFHSVRKKLAHLYCTEVDELESILNRDLTRWKMCE